MKEYIIKFNQSPYSVFENEDELWMKKDTTETLLKTINERSDIKYGILSLKCDYYIDDFSEIKIDDVSYFNINIVFLLLRKYLKQKSNEFIESLSNATEDLSKYIWTFLLAEKKLQKEVDDLDYLYEYGQTLAKLHETGGTFPEVKDRRFFHIPEKQYFSELNIEFVYEYLISNQPQIINKCFCHGDFHYANILWQEKHISAILDFELSGWGNKEFDIAWALILRPGQKFMNTDKEILLFRDGYLSVGNCNWDYVKYYMVLIYSYFYRIGKEDAAYQSYIKDVFINYCKK